MKKYILILATFFILASCTSIEKLVEKGDYDGAVLMAIRKLEGKKNKKTKHVQGLEEAFAKINQRDLSAASRLLDQNRDSNWDNLFAIYEKIDGRQNAIEPLLPLVSKDGYKAIFKFVKTSKLLNEAADNAAAYDYNRGVELLEEGKSGDKDAARSAHRYFVSTKRYVEHYRDAKKLANQALYYGKTRVAVEVVNNAHVIIPAAFEREVLDIHIADLNSRWTEYYTGNTANHPIDVKAVLEINDMDISPEREVINRYVDTKEIKDGWEYVLDRKGNVKKDTSGNDLKVDRYITIQAKIKQVIRTKSAFVTGNVVYYDLHTGEIFRSERVNVEAKFEDIACRVRGDKRAVKANRKKHIKQYSAPFPSDFDLTMDAAENLKHALKSEIERAII